MNKNKRLDPLVKYELFNRVKPLAMQEANIFYNKIKDKPLEFLTKYEQIVKPKSFCDMLSYSFDIERVGRHTATQYALLERIRPELFTNIEK